MRRQMPMTRQQKEIMSEFYRIKPTRVIFDKKVRKNLWSKATRHEDFDLRKIRRVCPALAHQIVRSCESGDGKVSGYKINPLFFVRIEHCTTIFGKKCCKRKSVKGYDKLRAKPSV